ncbi:recombinase family protein [Micromonospora sp. WMMD729]|uniref:recombinase family protein n=1 Tax=Micromonospora sp. WMMD729 TaxID=3404127 RepID=UPI003BF5FD72
MRGPVRQAVPVLAYIRSLPEESAAVLSAQAAAIRRAVVARQLPVPYELVWTIRDEAAEHPARLSEAVRRLEMGAAQALFVTRWDRLGPTDFVARGLRRHAIEFGWALEVLDDMLDDQAANVGSSGLRSARTIEGLAQARSIGIRLGRPRRCQDDVLRAVVEMSVLGARQVDIADRLNEEGVATPGGGERWYPSHVSRLLRTQDARQYRRTLLERLSLKAVPELPPRLNR